jgi:hypothetical protein
MHIYYFENRFYTRMSISTRKYLLFASKWTLSIENSFFKFKFKRFLVKSHFFRNKALFNYCDFTRIQDKGKI